MVGKTFGVADIVNDRQTRSGFVALEGDEETVTSRSNDEADGKVEIARSATAETADENTSFAENKSSDAKNSTSCLSDMWRKPMYLPHLIFGVLILAGLIFIAVVVYIAKKDPFKPTTAVDTGSSADTSPISPGTNVFGKPSLRPTSQIDPTKSIVPTESPTNSPIFLAHAPVKPGSTDFFDLSPPSPVPTVVGKPSTRPTQIALTTRKPTMKPTEGPTRIKQTHVIIVGAGAAGLTAAYTLQKHGGFDFLILEASDSLGGRVRGDYTFTDYPVDLGGSMIQDAGYPEEIKGEKLDVEISSFKEMGARERQITNDGKIKRTNGYGYNMFVNSCWYCFFAENIAPKDRDAYVYGCRVDSVDYQSPDERVEVKCGSQIYTADHVIVTVPLSVLKERDITFNPLLPQSITQHLQETKMLRGLKFVVEFSDKFYPETFFWTEDESYPDGKTVSEAYFWDYSFLNKEVSSKPVISGYIVGRVFDKEYDELGEGAVVEKILQRLDSVFDNRASETYVKHVMVNWAKEPFVRGTYSNRSPKFVDGAQVVQDNLIVAGEAFPVPNKGGSGWVHSAAFSGRDAAEKIISLS